MKFLIFLIICITLESVLSLSSTSSSTTPSLVSLKPLFNYLSLINFDPYNDNNLNINFFLNESKESEEAEETVRQIHESFIKFGLVLLKDHEFKAAEKVIESSENLFALDLTNKIENDFETEQEREEREVNTDYLKDKEINKEDRYGRGYLKVGQESGVKTYYEVKEGYSYGNPNNKNNMNEDNNKKILLKNQNIWPKDLNNQDLNNFNQLYDNFSYLSTVLIYSIVFYRQKNNLLTLPVHFNEGNLISLMRIFHYYSKKSPRFQQFLVDNNLVDNSSTSLEDDPRFTGSSPHKDWGLATIILQSQTTGLEYIYEGEWHGVPYIPGSLIVNCGDFFSRLTYNQYHSPVHRVITPKDNDRTSFVYFFYPNYESNSYADIKLETNYEDNVKKVLRNKLDIENNIDNKKEVKVEVDGVQLEYNTLYKLEDGSAEDLSFGEFIEKKWKEVDRSK